MILIWYVTRRFLATFCFSIVAMCLLFVVIDLFEHLDVFLKRHVAFMDAVWYYLVFLPYMIKLLIPVSSLLAALFSVGRLATSNELTAMRAGGMSFTRFLLPFIMLASMISAFQLWFDGWVVPRANTAKLTIERSALKQTGQNTLSDLRFRDHSTRNISIAYYNEEKKVAQHVVVEEFGDAIHPRLLWKLEAAQMRWDDKRGWIADSVRKRSFDSSGQRIEWLYNTTIPFSIRHEQIRKLQLTPDELTFDEIPSYIATQRSGGKDTRRQEIEYYAGWSFPFANIIVVFIAVPFAAVRRKGGIAMNIAAAMVVAFTYIIGMEVIKAVGGATMADPLIIGWLANVLFAVIALVGYGLFRRRAL